MAGYHCPGHIQAGCINASRVKARLQASRSLDLNEPHGLLHPESLTLSKPPSRDATRKAAKRGGLVRNTPPSYMLTRIK
jgi:hypothetical protein